MTTHADTRESLALSERVVALLRTAVPALWGTLSAWALAQIAGVLPPVLADPLAAALGSDVVAAVVVAAVIAAWYAAWRWAEPHVPEWLVRVVLGSARTPSYALTPARLLDDGAVDIAFLSASARSTLHELRDALAGLDEDDPLVEALDHVLQA
ncbi:hypothetical protein [Cellulomonas oligotrophica]|uniref:Uncharacterized protein n=1 Tax=Cellulomonas oligotrophica TaxID=931536 RepID=A0A7Y9JYF3_9CELL|nr:hypothetical protein [Cellulomonas oligotrophica]NYD87768.1 hypothetical protein [Cellulomonas oligotrophica]GIG33027.1 hypothetical protein Col01nite_21860 [Cellulomonas oligotrophica]